MPNLCIYLPNHNYEFNDYLYVSWLDGNYYAVNIDDAEAGDGLIYGTMAQNSFYLSTKSETDGNATTDIVQYSTTITDGYVRLNSESGVSTISGLDHLEGETVYVTSGGNLIGQYTVASGEITLASELTTYQVGLPYALRVRTMRFEIPGESTQGKIKRITETTLRHLKTKGGEAGKEWEGTEYYSDLNCEFSDRSKDARILTKGGFSRDEYTLIKSDKPYPMTILSTIVELEIEN